MALFSISLFIFLAWKIFPALQGDELIVNLLNIQVLQLNTGQRAKNFIYCRTIEFIAANAIGYLINATWVFKRGNKAVLIEIFMFYAISLAGFLAASIFGAFMITYLNATSGSTYITNTVLNSTINYIGRRFWVFKHAP